MQTETAKYPQFYGELSVQVFAPQYYHSTTSNFSDHYSKQIVKGKREDLSAFFFDQIKEVFTKLPFKPNIIVMAPSHLEGKFSPTLHSLALQLSKHYGIPYANIIDRIREGKKLTSCSDRDERYEQVKGAFKVNTVMYSMEGLKIVLLDDTKTTGFTTLECAKELKSAGANDVVAVCLGINL